MNLCVCIPGTWCLLPYLVHECARPAHSIPTAIHVNIQIIILGWILRGETTVSGGDTSPQIPFWQKMNKLSVTHHQPIITAMQSIYSNKCNF